jgi:hypothetical protein
MTPPKSTFRFFKKSSDEINQQSKVRHVKVCTSTYFFILFVPREQFREFCVERENISLCCLYQLNFLSFFISLDDFRKLPRNFREIKI